MGKQLAFKSGKRSRLAIWYEKANNFNIESLFSRKREPGPPRTVFVNQPLPPDYYDDKGRLKKEHIYRSNQVITSKYTVITFVPRNLLEQFRRIANIFFLAIAILQFFPIFPTVSPGLVILPLLIVLGITMLKDGYEDIKRHQSDRHVNYSTVRVLAGGDFENPNPVQRKSKTFVPAIPPRLRRPRKKSAEDVEALPEDDREYDSEDDENLPVEEGRRFRPQSQNINMSDQPHWKKTIWEDLRVGDFIKIMDDESFPADLLICSTSEDENVAYVETKNLDGETNLKSRNANPALTHLRSAAACADKRNAFRVECDRPDNNLYKISAAVVNPDGTKSSVDSQQVLLRGTVLRNTRWVIGVVLFTGEDTKIVLNSGGAPSKRSKVERQMNPQVFVNLGILAVMAVVCAIADAILEQRYYPLGAPWLYNDNESSDNPHVNGLVTFAFALITFQNIIPISLYISIEVVRTAQALFIYFDREIYYEKTDSPTLARSWNLSDDLGQIEYIFSDKTGTLTQNAMVFRQCSVAGRVYTGNEEPEEGDDMPQKVEVPSDPKFSRVSPPPGKESTSSSEDVPDPLHASAIQLTQGVLTRFRDSALAADIAAAVGAPPDSDRARAAERLYGFWTTLALCHTALVTVDSETNAIEYKAQSPDEAALVQAAADVGFVFRGRERDIMRLQTPFAQEVEEFQLLHILEFNSSRKRMSVVLRRMDERDGRILLLTKGADNVIFERLRPGDDELKKITGQHLDMFASEGLRTLTLAWKVVPEDAYEQWAEVYNDAITSLDNREEKVDAVCEQLEHSLELLGATAIEDRLQDGVPETIADLKEAGIKIWVATGDKLETAIAIGHSTNLIQRDNNIIIVRGNADGTKSVWTQMCSAVQEFFPDSGILEDEGIVDNPTASHPSPSMGYPLQRVATGMSDIVGHGNGERPGGFVLVIDGGALGMALDDDRSKRLLLRLAMECEGVICCRVSPLQKALIVRLVKDGLGAMTLAIGDGANDVSMIQAADVGVGISGEEGLQAVNSSDYAIAQFRFLKRLLLVHGHWSYARNGNLIVNFFYKNIICIGLLWWFQIYCAWSSEYVMDYTYLLFWNTFWTIAPPIATGLFDRVADDHILMALPELYRHSREGEYFGMGVFLVYMFDGIVQSAIVFFLVLYSYTTTSARWDGYDVYIYEFSTTMVFAAAIAASLFNGLNTNVWTGWVFFAVAIGPVLLWVYTAVYNAIPPSQISSDIYGNNHYLFQSPEFWFGMLLTIILALLPRYIWKAYEFGYITSDIDRVRWLHKQQPDRDFEKDRGRGGLAHLRRPLSQIDHRRSSVSARRLNNFHASQTDMSTGLRSVHRGFDFATEENGVALRRLQSNLSERQSEQQTKRRKRHVPSFSLPRSLRRKKPPHPTVAEEPSGSESPPQN
ncbi:phospholipid-translocating P-type ATPase [Obba rivulosa]|uniref:Phospholipid-transporting ATPase n=1 Tax=Obba rivulosa TaxID=1052685 RepID=A0A8E2B4F5_9APHY|nr:phospholipid-translocating P-type ATPase [Obba rivulosa]